MGTSSESSEPWKGLSRAVSLEQHGPGDLPASLYVTGPQSAHRGQSLRTSASSYPGSWLGTFLDDATSIVFKR